MQALHYLLVWCLMKHVSVSLFIFYLIFLRLHVLKGAVVTVTLILGICGELNTRLHSQAKANAGNVTNLQ